MKMRIKSLKTLSLIVLVSLVPGLTKGDGNNSNALSIEEQLQKFIHDLCFNKTGNDAAYEGVERAFASLKDCQREEPPKHTKNSTFNTHCLKFYTTLDCMKRFTTSIEPCLNDQLRDKKDILITISINLLEFWCQNDGEKFNSFLDEKALRCLHEKKNGLIKCGNSPFPGYFHQNLNIRNLREFVFGPEICKDLDYRQECVTKEFQTCDEPILANLAESLYNNIRKGISCNKSTDTIDSSAKVQKK